MTGGGPDAGFSSPPGSPFLLVAQLLVTAAAIGSQAAGVLGGGITPLACALLLLFGLPHGTLDLELLRRRDNEGAGLGLLLTAYGACAAAMYLLWQAAPLVALAVFIVIAFEHFAEDWSAMGSRFCANGTAFALIALPALLHRDEIADIFAILGGRSAAALADLLLLAAPIAGLIALSGVGLLWQRQSRSLAIGLAAAMVAELVLPPVIGFTIFFCFVHSPAQLRASLATIKMPSQQAWWRVIVPLTLAALLIATAIGAAAIRAATFDGSNISVWLHAAFVTLSVLTLPHMAVPHLARVYRARYAPRSRARGYVPSTRTHSL